MQASKLSLTILIVLPVVVLAAIILKQQEALRRAHKENVRLRTQIAQSAKEQELPPKLPQEIVEKLAKIERLRARSEADLLRQEAYLQTVQEKASSDEGALASLLGRSGGDQLLGTLLDQRALAVQKRDMLKERDPESSQIADLEEQILELNKRIGERKQGILVGLKFRVEGAKASLERLRSAREEELSYLSRRARSERLDRHL